MGCRGRLIPNRPSNERKPVLQQWAQYRYLYKESTYRYLYEEEDKGIVSTGKMI